MTELDPEMSYKIAREYYSNGDFLRARYLLKYLSACSVELIKIESGLLNGMMEFYWNRWSEAERLLSKWLEENPAHPEAAKTWFTLARTHMAVKEYSKVEPDLQKVTELDAVMGKSVQVRALRHMLEDVGEAR